MVSWNEKYYWTSASQNCNFIGGKSFGSLIGHTQHYEKSFSLHNSNTQGKCYSFCLFLLSCRTFHEDLTKHEC
jgi:hypothetical protein